MGMSATTEIDQDHPSMLLVAEDGAEIFGPAIGKFPDALEWSLRRLSNSDLGIFHGPTLLNCGPRRWTGGS
jgi:hypothetical protein